MYFKNAPKSNKCLIIVAIENAKLKLLNMLSSYSNKLCDSSKLFFFTLINPRDMGPLDILRIIVARFYAHASLIRFRFRNRDIYMYC